MVYPISNSKVTVESENVRFSFTTPFADVGSSNSGKTHFLRTGDLHGMVKTQLPEKETTPVIDEKALCDKPVNPLNDEALRLVAARARLIEGQIHHNARRIELAHEQAKAALSDVAHDFNMAVLAASQRGLTHDEIMGYLTAEGIHGLSHTVATVSGRDWDALYPSVVE